MTEEKMLDLLDEADKMRSFSHSPYSRFAVGAALLCTDGAVYGGCNIENASYGATVCAERTAVFKAVSEGHKDFAAIAITGGPSAASADNPCPPCGICRQVLAEFCDPDELSVILRDAGGAPVSYTLSELLPLSFTEESM